MRIKTLSSRVVYENPWLTLREDRIERPDGSPGLYSVVEQPDFAVVIPVDGDGFHLVEQYRYPVRRRSWEFPSGSFPSGVTGTVAEMAEETGYTAARLTHLGRVDCANSMATVGCHVFAATGLTPGEPRREDSEQDMRAQWFARTEVERMVREGTITDGPTLSAYLLFTLRDTG